MWWQQPRLKEFPALIPANILDVAVRAYAVVQVGGLSGSGPERGRNFEALFYGICDHCGVLLSERAGGRSVAAQYSASGLAHEVDGATRAASFTTHWELKHLTQELPKNELLIFHGKSLDFLNGSNPFFAKVPMLRFLMSGYAVRDECRYFAAQWGIMLIEPNRFPLALLYEAVARGAGECLSQFERDAVLYEVRWACRPLQQAVRELADWCGGVKGLGRFGQDAKRYAREVMDVQEQIGLSVADYLDDQYPDWIDELAEHTWKEVGGW